MQKIPKSLIRTKFITKIPIVLNTNIAKKIPITQTFASLNSKAKMVQIKNGKLDKTMKLLTRVLTILAQSRMKTKVFLDLQYIVKIDQGRKIINKSFDGLLKCTHKFANSLTKTSSKVHEFLNYN